MAPVVCAAINGVSMIDAATRRELFHKAKTHCERRMNGVAGHNKKRVGGCKEIDKVEIDGVFVGQWLVVACQ